MKKPTTLYKIKISNEFIIAVDSEECSFSDFISSIKKTVQEAVEDILGRISNNYDEIDNISFKILTSTKNLPKNYSESDIPYSKEFSEERSIRQILEDNLKIENNE